MSFLFQSTLGNVSGRSRLEIHSVVSALSHNKGYEDIEEKEEEYIMYFSIAS